MLELLTTIWTLNLLFVGGAVVVGAGVLGVVQAILNDYLSGR